MTNLEKRLIALSSLGIWIENYGEYMDVECSDANKFNFHDELKAWDILYRGRYYNSTIENILDDIDYCLESMQLGNLLEIFSKCKFGTKKTSSTDKILFGFTGGISLISHLIGHKVK